MRACGKKARAISGNPRALRADTVAVRSSRSEPCQAAPNPRMLTSPRCCVCCVSFHSSNKTVSSLQKAARQAETASSASVAAGHSQQIDGDNGRLSAAAQPPVRPGAVQCVVAGLALIDVAFPVLHCCRRWRATLCSIVCLTAVLCRSDRTAR